MIVKRTLLALLGVFFALSFVRADELWETAPGRERIFNALVEVFEDHYWNPEYRDWAAWAAEFHDGVVDSATKTAFESALRNMVYALHDDHSRFVSGPAIPSAPEVAGPALEPGLGFRHAYLAGAGLVVERVFPGTPAAAAGLRRGDVVQRVNGQDLRDLTYGYEADEVLTEAVRAGGVNLGVRHRAAFRSLTLTPAPVDFSQVVDQPQAEMLDAQTGYLYLPSFQAPGVGQEVHQLIRDLSAQGAHALVLDLRDNLGGRLGELGLVLGAFIEGPWVEAVSRDGVVWRSSYQASSTEGRNVLETAAGEPFAGDTVNAPVHFTGPVAVLVSRRNSSAGEVAPLVLQALGRATVVGEPTEGNVEAIQAFDLPGGNLVYVAVANLQGANGQDFSDGVLPDVASSATLADLARGFDAPVAEAVRTLHALPFTPGKFF